MKKIEAVLLSLIVLLALILRLYEIDRPIADWHSWRQADTAAVARNFIKEGFNPLVPRFDDMSTQANGLDNPNRYRFVEFPVFNSIIAGIWSITGVSDITARLTTVFITLGSTVLLFFLVRIFSSWQTAALASFFFATIPYNVFYSSTILPAPLMVFFTLSLYLSFYKWLQNEKKIIYFFLSIISANLAILTWPIAVFFTIPLIYLTFAKYGLESFKKPSLYVFAIFSLAPFALWRFWISQFPEGIPNWQFLINEGNIRFKGAFFRWLVVERLGGLILSVTGFSLFILGVIRKPENQEKLFYFSYLVAFLVYFTVFASGNIRHDYYQIPGIPILAIFMAIGTKFLLNLPSNYFVSVFGKIMAVVLVIFTFAFGFFEVRGFYWINNPSIVQAGQAVDRLLPQDATVIAPYNGDAAFLYQTNRAGYPTTDRPLAELIENGTKYLVSVDVEDEGIRNLATHCTVVEETESYVIVEMFTECIGK